MKNTPTSATLLLCFHGGYASPRIAFHSPAHIERLIDALEVGQNLVVTENGHVYPSSMTPLYTNGEMVLAEVLHDGSTWRQFDAFSSYSVESAAPLEGGEVWELEIRPMFGAIDQRLNTVYCSPEFKQRVA